MADVALHSEDRSPWVPSSALRAIIEEAGADERLLEDLADVRGTMLDDP